MKTRMSATTLLCSLVLAACGGGGGSQDPVNARPATTSVAAPQLTEPYEPLSGTEMGMGIYGLSYWDQSFAMADVVRQSQFRSLDWGTDVGADANGAPTQDFYLIFSAGIIGAGTYKLQFTGQADVTVSASPTGRIEQKIYNSITNTTTADVVLPANSTGHTWLTFKNTRRSKDAPIGSGATDIKMWRPSYPTDGSATFTKEFLTAMRKTHVIRTMDFVSANSNPSENWADRTRPSFIGNTGSKGQSWELVVALANATGRDIWINVPVKANDEYIKKLSQLIRYGSDGVEPYTAPKKSPAHAPLRPELKVYLEYGNEVWNTTNGFMGFHWAKALSDSVRLNPAHPIAYDGPVSDEYLALRRWVAYRSATISKTFRETFSDAEMMTRVRPILAAQVGNGNNYLRDGLLWAEDYLGAPSSIWYGGGGAAYYDSTINPTDTAAGTMQAYFDGLPSPQFALSTATDAIWTKAFGIKTVAYEGGPGPGGSSSGLVSGKDVLSYTYNHDPRMKDRMIIAHDTWLANGGDLLVYYVYSASAPWSFSNGLSNSTISETDGVKFQALEAIRTKEPQKPTLGMSVPGRIYLRDAASKMIERIAGTTDWKYFGTAYRIRPVSATLRNPEFVLIPFRTTAAGTYKIGASIYDGQAQDRIELSCNGKVIGDLSPSSGGAINTAVDSQQLAVSLPAGLSVCRLKAKAGVEIWIKDLVVSN